MACQIAQPILGQGGAALRQLFAPCHQRGNIHFLRRAQQGALGEQAAEEFAAAQARQWYGQEQTEQRRRQPGEQRRGYEIHHDCGHGAQEHVAAMIEPCIHPGGAAGVAPLRFPAGIAPEEHLDDMTALNHHEDRRVQRRQNGFDQEAGTHADDAARAAANPLRQQRANQPERLGDEQHDHAEPEERDHDLDIEPGPGGEQLEIVAEVFRAYQARLHREREA